jgi:hypothetical protein
MKKLLVLLAVMFVLGAGCKPPHPSIVKSDPAFDPNVVSGVLIAPAISTVAEMDDPKQLAEPTTNRILAEQLGERTDYTFISAEQFKGAVMRGKLQDRYIAFRDLWGDKRELDAEFLRQLKQELNVETVLIPHVYLWHKDEADYRERATASATQVGITLTLVEMGTGKILWEGTDENYLESVRSEDREVITTGGMDRKVEGVSATGKDQYAAPPYDDVVILVLQSLVGAIPERTATR